MVMYAQCHRHTHYTQQFKCFQEASFLFGNLACARSPTESVAHRYKRTRTHAYTRKSPRPNGHRPLPGLFCFLLFFSSTRGNAAAKPKRTIPRESLVKRAETLFHNTDNRGTWKKPERRKVYKLLTQQQQQHKECVTHIAMAQSTSFSVDSSFPDSFFFYPHNKPKTFFLRSGNISSTGPSGSCAAAPEITGGALGRQK